MKPVNGDQQSLHTAEQASHPTNHYASTTEPGPEPPRSPPFRRHNERKSYIPHGQIPSSAPPPRGDHIDNWTNQLLTFAAILFGAWSIISWQSRVYANDIASQAVRAQVQANQLAMYSFCALNLVFPSLCAVQFRIKYLCFRCRQLMTSRTLQMKRAHHTWPMVPCLPSLLPSCHLRHRAATTMAHRV